MFRKKSHSNHKASSNPEPQYVDDTAQNIPQAEQISPVEWTASEFIDHEKPLVWYGIMGLGALALTGLAYLLTKDWISSSMILLASVAFIVVGAKKPQTLNYRVDENGLSVGKKTYLYDDFKSFSVVEEGAIGFIYLLPLKRFMPSLSIYYAPEDRDKVISTIQNYLPQEFRTTDLLDRLMQKIRF